MCKKLNAPEYKRFEDIKNVRLDGSEYTAHDAGVITNEEFAIL